MKKCPYCAEEVQDEAIKCKHCGEMLTAENSTLSSNKTFEWICGEKKGMITSKDADEAYSQIAAQEDTPAQSLTEIFPDGKRGITHIPCNSCKRMRDIESDKCPYCGNTDNFCLTYIGYGAAIGLIISALKYSIFGWEGEKLHSDFIEAFLSGCLVTFITGFGWACIIVGAIAGGVIGEVRKDTIKDKGLD